MITNHRKKSLMCFMQFSFYSNFPGENYQKIVDSEKVQKFLQFECLKYFFADLSVSDEKKILSQSLSLLIVFHLNKKNFRFWKLRDNFLKIAVGRLF